MKYINTKTGAVIETTSKITGKLWKPYTKEKAKEQPKQEEYVEQEVNLEDMTKDELVALAKENEIEVNPKNTKDVIIETIAKAFE